MRVYNGNELEPIPLAAFLSYMSNGTRIHVKVDNWDIDFFGLIETAGDVVDICKRVYDVTKHHPRVVEFGVLDGFKNGVDIICK